MNYKPKKNTGIKRVWAALFHSIDGLRFAISNEVAFQQEVFVAIIAIIVLFFLPLSLAYKGLLLLATLIILVVELLNSSIENVVNLISPEYHILAKRAKDIGSAAVLVSIVVAIILWGGAIFTIFFP